MKYILFSAFIFLVSIVISQKVISAKTNDGQNSINAEANNTEKTIKYEVLESKNGFQIRKYPDLTVATTKLNDNSYSNNSSSGFRKIASYIFGGNSSNMQIAMTSPVQMEMGTEPTMSFFMPNNMNSADLPKPNRTDVLVQVQPSKIVAVIEFSGWASDQVLQEQFNLLKTKLKKESIDFEDSYSFLGYNPPYKLFNRKNEVTITLKNYKI